MECPECGFVMDPFEKECPRCARQKGRPAGQAAEQAQQAKTAGQAPQAKAAGQGPAMAQAQAAPPMPPAPPSGYPPQPPQPPAARYQAPSPPPGFAEFFSFRMMVTPMFIKVIYVLGVLGCFIGGFMAGGGMARMGGMYVMLGILVGMLVIVVSNVLWRICCEGIILFFSIHEVLTSMERKP